MKFDYLVRLAGIDLKERINSEWECTIQNIL